MAETKKKSGFKQALQKTKDFAKKKTQQAKNYGKQYGLDMRTSYDIGYSRGWDDAYDIPSRFLCKLAAGIGYRNGVKSRHKSDKAIKQHEKKRKQNKN